MSVRSRWLKKLRDAKAAAARARRVLARHPAAPRKPAAKLLWHPGARVLRGNGAGSFVPAGPKLLWHTTEGSSAEGAISAFRHNNSWPHFTLEPTTGRLFQHLPLNVAARTLQHPPGIVETNRANVIQVELVGFAKNSPLWADAEYKRIAALARWIEANAGVPRVSTVKFTSTPQRQATRLSGTAWLKYSGHIGHEHAPGNHHWDPGSMRIDKVLEN